MLQETKEHQLREVSDRMTRQISKYSDAWYRARVVFLANCLASVLFACAGRSTPPGPPDLPADSWSRDTAPLLSAGARGGDGLLDISIADPDALYDARIGIWNLWYQTGRAKTYTSSDNQMVIRHAQSADGGSTWIVDPVPALTLPGDPSAWDATHTETPSVIYDPDAPDDRKFKLYYSGASGQHPLGFPDYQIGLAVSADGRTFHRLPAEESPYHQAGLVLRAAEALPDVNGLAGGIVSDPEVQLIHGVYQLWFSSFGNDAKLGILAFGISHATSADGIHWTPSPNNPIPGLRNSRNAGGQQPSVAWNPVLGRWEMWFTSDTEGETALIPSTFNPALGFWLATSTDAVSWKVDYRAPRDVYWRPGSPDETYGLLTGADVVIVGGTRHLFYTGWGSIRVPQGFIVPVRDNRKYVPAVLNLIHATKDAGR
jgi:hypothetical protein